MLVVRNDDVPGHDRHGHARRSPTPASTSTTCTSAARPRARRRCRCSPPRRPCPPRWSSTLRAAPTASSPSHAAIGYRAARHAPSLALGGAEAVGLRGRRPSGSSGRGWCGRRRSCPATWKMLLDSFALTGCVCGHMLPFGSTQGGSAFFGAAVAAASSLPASSRPRGSGPGSSRPGFDAGGSWRCRARSRAGRLGGRRVPARRRATAAPAGSRRAHGRAGRVPAEVRRLSGADLESQDGRRTHGVTEQTRAAGATREADRNPGHRAGT